MRLADGVDTANGSVSRLQWMRANVAAGLAVLGRAPRSRSGATLAWRIPLHLALGAIIAIVAIAATMIFVDGWAIGQARQLPLWMIHLFNRLTDFGKSNWILVPTGGLLVAIAVLASPALGHTSRLVLVAVSLRLSYVFLAVAVPGLFVSIVKRVIGRARPMVGGSIDPYLYWPFKWVPQYASLPSGHATNACAAAFALGVLWPRGRPLFWSYALIIVVSRVVVTAHHPSDVLAGALVGIIGAMVVRDWFAARRLAFVPDGQGGIGVMPGPSFARIKRVARQLAGQ